MVEAALEAVEAVEEEEAGPKLELTSWRMSCCCCCWCCWSRPRRSGSLRTGPRLENEKGGREDSQFYERAFLHMLQGGPKICAVLAPLPKRSYVVCN